MSDVLFSYQDLRCEDDSRREQLRADPSRHGIDYLEVATSPADENQRVLRVFFIEKSVPSNLSTLLNELDGDTTVVSITGGERIGNIRVTDVARELDHLRVEVSEPGDFSTYTLHIDNFLLDPPYAQVDFSFKAGCPSRFDCKPRHECPPDDVPEPLIDYLAKDYASFRRALLDLVPSRIPNWTDRHEADLGIALIELLSYVGDQLSYYQDAVANEAFLETARRRSSVRRHALLVDYAMHDGVSARTFVQIRVAPGTHGRLPKGTQILTRLDEPLRADPAPHPARLTADVADEALEKARAVFETVGDATLRSELNEIPIHAWGNRDCCIPRGATSIDLARDLVTVLRQHDFLLLEEVRGPETGLPQDADPAHRAVVRLTEVQGYRDILRGVDLTRVTWNERDALRFPLCIATPEAEGEGPVAVARGNLVQSDHGRSVSEQYPAQAAPGSPGIRSRPSYRFTLRRGPVSARIRPRDERGLPASAASILADEGHGVVPEASIDVEAPTGLLEGWDPVPNLLESEPFHRHFVVEAENDGRATIRFGNRGFGLEPPDDSFIQVKYRIGVGREGNIGAEALAHAIDPGDVPDWPDIATIRNPLPATGGVDPESSQRVKQLAPAAFRAVQHRAVTADDYARIAERHPEVFRAVASFRWTGSWHTVYVATDPRGVADLSHDLERRLRNWVYAHTQAGYDLEIEPPVFVPLEIEITICVCPDHFRADVEQAVLAELGTGALPSGHTGFFDPDKFTFGQPLYLSTLYAAIEKVEGVDSAVVTMFKRYAKVAAEELDTGVVSAGRTEILRLDNDPNFPERGQFRLTMVGGK
jgi:hypothetical protein